MENVKRSPLELAAIATAAVPGLSAARAGRLPDDAEDYDSALVEDAKGGRWRVRSPRHEDASLRLETELRALGGLSPALRATLPFAVPTVAGTVRQGTLKTFVYHHVSGHVLTLEELLSSPEVLAAQLGRGLAAVHGLDQGPLERAGLPTASAEELRRARLSELDQVAASGKVPSVLLKRWEAAMEEAPLWRFHPAVVHGDLSEEQLFVEGDRLVAVTGWSDLHVGDPAEDLAWLLAVDDQGTIDAVLAAYTEARGGRVDQHLMRRATLAAEFALARWLSRALTRGDAARVTEAEELLRELALNVSELGERPEGVVERARPERPAGEQTPVADGAALVSGAVVADGAADVADADAEVDGLAAPAAGQTDEQRTEAADEESDARRADDAMEDPSDATVTDAGEGGKDAGSDAAADDDDHKAGAPAAADDAEPATQAMPLLPGAPADDAPTTTEQTTVPEDSRDDATAADDEATPRP